MTTIEAINKIKQLFADAGQLNDPLADPQPSPAEPSVNMASEYILKDGTKVIIDKLEAGGIAKIVDASGAEAFAPVGEHELADGIIIVVGENGVISEVKAPAVAQPDAVVSEDLKKMKEKMDSLVELINQMKSNFESQIAESNAKNEKLASGMTQLSDVIIGMCQTPSAEPTKPANAFVQHMDSKRDKISEFLELAKSIN